IPRMNRVALVFRVVEVALRKRVRGRLRRGTFTLPLEPVLLSLSPRVLTGHAVNLDTDLLLIRLGGLNGVITAVAVYLQFVALRDEEVLPVLNRVALIVFAERFTVGNSLVGARR